MSSMRPVPPTLAVKLASIAVHADEFTGPAGHGADRVALRQLLDDPEVKDWLDDMTKAGLAPVKRQ